MKFTKSIKASVLAVALASSIAYADGLKEEKGGGFVGFQAGTSLLQQKDIWFSSIASNTYTYRYSRTSAAYGVLGGYEHWFSNSLGMRGYALFSGANFYVLQFSVGADVIYNITNVADGNLGVFAGLQAGGVYWLNSWYWWSSSVANESAFAFDMALNLGVRWSQNEHVIELLGKIPFIETKTGTSHNSNGTIRDEYYSKETFSFVVRYIYRF